MQIEPLWTHWIKLLLVNDIIIFKIRESFIVFHYLDENRSTQWTGINCVFTLSCASPLQDQNYKKSYHSVNFIDLKMVS